MSRVGNDADVNLRGFLPGVGLKKDVVSVTPGSQGSGVNLDVEIIDFAQRRSGIRKNRDPSLRPPLDFPAEYFHSFHLQRAPPDNQVEGVRAIGQTFSNENFLLFPFPEHFFRQGHQRFVKIDGAVALRSMRLQEYADAGSLKAVFQ